MQNNLTRRAALSGLAIGLLPLNARGAVFPVVGKVERLDPALDALIDADAPVERILDGFTWSEGPVWVGGADGYLLVSDPRANVIRRWSHVAGGSEWLRPSGYAGSESPTLNEPGTNGLILARGGIVASDSGNRAVVRIDLKTRAKQVLCSEFEGRRFNSPNDLVLARDGAIYFTDPPHGLKNGASSPARQMDYTGVFRLSTDNKVTLIDRTVFPNGISLSPDGRTLYATDRLSGWAAWTLDSEGRASDRRQFVDRAAIAGGDGFKVDTEGNLWASSRDGISILSPAGKRLGIIRGDDVISNCEIGADGYLYMSCNHTVVRVRVKAKKLRV